MSLNNDRRSRGLAGEHGTLDRDVEELEIGFWLRIIRRRARLIGIVIVAFLLTAAAASLLQPAAYVARTEVRIPKVGVGEGTATAEPNVALEVRFVESESLREEVKRRLGFGPRISTSGNGDAGTIIIEAKGRTDREAVQVANTYAATYIERRRQAAEAELQNAGGSLRMALDEVDRALAAPNLNESQRERLLKQRTTYLEAESALLLRAQLLQQNSASVLSPASANASSRVLSIALYLLAAAVAGVVVGVALAAIVDRHRKRVDGPNGAADLLGIPLLGTVPPPSKPARRRFRRRRGPRLEALPQVSRGSAGLFRGKAVPFAEPGTVVADAFALLRTRFQSLADDKPGTVQVIAADQDDLVHSVAVAGNLARSFARANLQTVLVWADFRDHETLHKGPGMSDVLAGTAQLRDVLVSAVAPTGLQILPAGEPPQSVADALSSPPFRHLLAELRTVADIAFIFTPPIAAHPEGQLVAAVVDAVIVVAGERSHRQRLTRGAEVLRDVGAAVLGLVFVGPDRITFREG